MTTEMRELADRLAIRELVERYSLALSRRDWEALGNCFHADAAWSVAPPFSLEFRTREGISAGISGLVEPHEFLVQMPHSIVIELAGDRATATSLIEEVGRMPEGRGGIRQYGCHHDQMTRIDGRWGFARRQFQPLFFDTSAVPGTTAGRARAPGP